MKLIPRASIPCLRQLLAFLFLATLSVKAQSENPTSGVFEKYKSRVLQIQVLEKNSKTKAVVGSAFWVGNDRAVTNYHVISKMIWDPEDYTATAILSDGKNIPLQIVAINVVHDLALIRLSGANAPYFQWTTTLPPKGTRLYALGNPFDLGMTIVEGTYSGNVEDSIFGKLHLTGSINPGMSGGAVIDGDGKVVGVSVASSGNQVGFLVPFQHAKTLLETPAGDPTAEMLKAHVAEQILKAQEDIVNKITRQPPEKIELGPIKAPGKPTAGFSCWANNESTKEDRHATIHSQCTTTDDVFIKDTLTSARHSIMHHGIQNKHLNSFQRIALAKNKTMHGNFGSGFRGDREDFTSYTCKDSFVKAGEADMQGQMCVRAYKELPGVYDVVWSGVSVMKDREWNLTSEISMSGVSLDQAHRLLKHYLDSYQWKKS